MIQPAIPQNERERLSALKEYAILDTLAEKEFDSITKIASEICQTPISLITLIDENRQWFKSKHGLEVTETPREYAFCAHAINEPESLLEVNDARQDIRFEDNPIVVGFPNVIFYAGVPLVNPQGYALGTLCVIDNKPRELSDNQIESLKSLSNLVVKLFELRKTNLLLEKSKNEAKDRNNELEKVAYVLSHDLKAPLNNIIGLTEILYNNEKIKIDKKTNEVLKLIMSTSFQLKNFIDGIISHYVGIKVHVENKQLIDLHKFITELISLLDPQKEHSITWQFQDSQIKLNEAALSQILMNLISNAIKYNNKPKVEISIKEHSNESFYFFEVKDNGIGINSSDQGKIWDTFATLGNLDRFNNKGTGIGLSTVKKLVEKLGGNLSLESEIGKGSIFKFTIMR
ncbi:MAG: GAF domain-containing sensor histidine kinase [Bacteroidota bacterium]|nr:GAF domain-containing sensor histidine kinase [Bacteroidota bacterium]